MALLILVIKIIIEFTMVRMNLFVVKLILMESKASGGTLKPSWFDSVVFIKRLFFCI